MKNITPQQQKVLDCIQVYINKTGFPPTRADICKELGFKSPNSAETHLRALEKKGFISIESGTSRGISINNPEIVENNNEYPIVGLVAAGSPTLASENVEKHGTELKKLIEEKNPERKVFFVYGGVEAEEREKIRFITEKSDGAIIVASYGTFSTGINIRNLHNIVFASPSKSRIRNLQSIGRGLRLKDNESSATLYDISDDLTHNEKENYTLAHFIERINIYNEEDFNYEIHNVELK